MRVHRMISILLLIEAKGKIKAKELAGELETSVRTIYKDVDDIPWRGETRKLHNIYTFIQAVRQ